MPYVAIPNVAYVSTLLSHFWFVSWVVTVVTVLHIIDSSGCFVTRMVILAYVIGRYFEPTCHFVKTLIMCMTVSKLCYRHAYTAMKYVILWITYVANDLCTLHISRHVEYWAKLGLVNHKCPWVYLKIVVTHKNRKNFLPQNWCPIVGGRGSDFGQRGIVVASAIHPIPPQGR